MARGLVKFYDRSKHFGFLVTPTGETYIGGSEAQNIEHELETGALVEFELESCIGGKTRAANARVILGANEEIED